MKDFFAKYFSLNSTSSVSQGNSIAIFCAIVAVFAFSYSLNMSAHRGIHFAQPQAAAAEPEKAIEGAPEATERSKVDRVSHRR